LPLPTTLTLLINRDYQVAVLKEAIASSFLTAATGSSTRETLGDGITKHTRRTL
jgi:hypothetical protein